MTVLELIEELQRIPNPRVPVVLRYAKYDEDEESTYLAADECTDVRWDGGRVILEGD